MASRGPRAYDHERWLRQQEREAERERKAAVAAQKAAEREERERRTEDRRENAARRTVEIEERVDGLGSLLVRGLDRSARIDFDRLRQRATTRPVDLGLDAAPLRPPDWTVYVPAAPGLMSRAFGGAARHRRDLGVAGEAFTRDQANHAAAERDRQQRVARARAAHAVVVEDERSTVAAHNHAVDEWFGAVTARERAAVERYLGLVVDQLPLPADFPRSAEVAYSSQGEQAVVRIELPGPGVVPEIRAIQYVQSKDEDKEVPRPAREIGEIYRLVVSQVTLLCLRDLFDADPAIDSVSVGGHVHATDPATGQPGYPCLISVSVDRATFEQLVLRDVAPDKCLRHLRAVVSAHPAAIEPITPIVDFDLRKYSFIHGLDAVAALDSRPDLMDMSWREFEHLIREVLKATGLEGWTTTGSHDGGVDAVMINRTPLRSGLTIVQVKQYRGVLGVQHLRELAGAMEEKKAGAGILVTTSWFTAGCWPKAKEHGRMELIDGHRLVALIQEHLGKDVLIGLDRPTTASRGPVAMEHDLPRP